LWPRSRSATPARSISELVHYRNDRGVDALAGSAAGRADVDTPVGAEPDEPGCHLASAGVVDTDEQHLGLVSHDPPFRLRERPETLACEAVRKDGDEDVDARLAEQVERLGDVGA
jgi:hypothetical protein